MKKLLVVALVLGMATMANAAIELYVDGAPVGPEFVLEVGQTVHIGIGNQQAVVGGDYGAYLDVMPMPGPFIAGPGALTANAPADSSFLRYEADYGYGNLLEFNVTIVNFATGSTIPAGEHFNFAFTCTELSPPDVSIELYNGSDLADTLTITQVPEPMTMSLLALGGLGLLRRRG